MKLSYEELEDLKIFMKMLNTGIQKLNLTKEEVIVLLDRIYK